MKKLFKLFFIASVFIASGQLSIAQQPDNQSGVTELYDYSVNLRADYGSLSRFYFIENSPERRDRFESFFKDQLSKLEKFNFNKLTAKI